MNMTKSWAEVRGCSNSHTADGNSCEQRLLKFYTRVADACAPKPEQVKISNLMRVLGEEATMDPTAIEQQVRQQMEERSQVRERPCGTSQRMSQCIDLPCSTPALSHGCTCTETGACRTPVWYSDMCCAHQGGGAEEHSDLAPHRRVTCC